MSKHSFDPVSLLFGLLFVVAGTAFLATDLDLTDLAAGWLVPLGAAFVGLLFFASATRRALVTRRLEDSHGDGEVDA